MCGRFTTAEDRQQVFNQTGLMPPPEWVPRYNVAPHQRVIAVRHDRHGERELAMLSWGLLPGWSRDASVAHRSINARAETLDSKDAFKGAFVARRCLILADGFYEWLPVIHASKKRPIYFRFREPLMLAGLWDRWQRPGVPVFESCAVVTRCSERRDRAYQRAHARDSRYGRATCVARSGSVSRAIARVARATRSAPARTGERE